MKRVKEMKGFFCEIGGDNQCGVEKRKKKKKKKKRVKESRKRKESFGIFAKSVGIMSVG